MVIAAGTSGDLERRLRGWAKSTETFEPLGDAIFVPAVMSDMAGQLMVRGREARIIKLDAKDSPYAFLDLPWDEALAAFRERVPARDNELKKLLKDYAERSDAARRLALDQIQAFVKSRLEQHIAEGGTYRDFANDLESGKESLGITTDDPSYLKNVFRTNLQSAYGAGKFRAITDPDVIEQMPFVQYRTVGDARVRPAHEILDRGIYHSASEAWHRIAPPNGFQCRCSLVAMSRDDVRGQRILGDVPADYVATAEFDKPPVARIPKAATRGVDAPADPIKVGSDWSETPPSNDVKLSRQIELFDPSQARGADGKWTAGGGGSSVGAKAKKAAPKKKAAAPKKSSSKKPSDDEIIAKARADLKKKLNALKAKSKAAKTSTATKAAAAKQKLKAAAATAKQKAEAKAAKAKEKADATKAKAAAKLKAKQEKEAAKAASHKAKESALKVKATAKAEAAKKKLATAQLKASHKKTAAALGSGDKAKMDSALKTAQAVKLPSTAKITVKLAHANTVAALQHASAHAGLAASANHKFDLAGKSTLKASAIKAAASAIAYPLTKNGVKNEVLKKLSPNDGLKAFEWATKWQSTSTVTGANAALDSVKKGSGWGNNQYHVTQTLLERDLAEYRKAGLIDKDGYVTLYRGVTGEQAKAMLKTGSTGKAKLRVRPASSWSIHRTVAAKFAYGGVITKAKIHYTRAFAVHKYENQNQLWGKEGEWVMLNEHGAFDVEFERHS